MSFGQAFDAKDQVRQAIDIVDLVGGYMQLRRQGRNFVGICPWHDDSRPSLQVNPDRQSFKCWVCDYGGDVFSFIMRAEGLEFREALEMLAERAGVQLHARPSGEGSAPTRPEDDKRTLYRALAWAEEQFHRCLLGAPEAQQGRDYLAGRGITRVDALRLSRRAPGSLACGGFCGLGGLRWSFAGCHINASPVDLVSLPPLPRRM